VMVVGGVEVAMVVEIVVVLEVGVMEEAVGVMAAAAERLSNDASVPYDLPASGSMCVVTCRRPFVFSHVMPFVCFYRQFVYTDVSLQVACCMYRS